MQTLEFFSFKSTFAQLLSLFFFGMIAKRTKVRYEICVIHNGSGMRKFPSGISHIFLCRHHHRCQWAHTISNNRVYPNILSLQTRSLSKWGNNQMKPTRVDTHTHKVDFYSFRFPLTTTIMMAKSIRWTIMNRSCCAVFTKSTCCAEWSINSILSCAHSQAKPKADSVSDSEALNCREKWNRCAEERREENDGEEIKQTLLLLMRVPYEEKRSISFCFQFLVSEDALLNLSSRHRLLIIISLIDFQFV